MKTIENIQQEITELSKEIIEFERQGDKKSISKAKKLRGKIPQLNECILYLKTNPTDEYLKKEVIKLDSRVSQIMKIFKPSTNWAYKNKQLKDFQKLWGVPKLRKQLTTLRYLLIQ